MTEQKLPDQGVELSRGTTFMRFGGISHASFDEKTEWGFVWIETETDRIPLPFVAKQMPFAPQHIGSNWMIEVQTPTDFTYPSEEEEASDAVFRKLFDLESIPDQDAYEALLSGFGTEESAQFASIAREACLHAFDAKNR